MKANDKDVKALKTLTDEEVKALKTLIDLQSEMLELLQRRKDFLSKLLK